MKGVRYIIPQKKRAQATEQDRPDVLKQRHAWFEGQPDLDPARLVFLDETWTSTAMGRKHGRAPKGQRLRVGVPHGHWNCRRTASSHHWCSMAINRLAFETYVAKVLLPELRAGDIVVMDNRSSHMGPAVRAMIEAAGASLRYLPP